LETVFIFNMVVLAYQAQCSAATHCNNVLEWCR